MTAPHDVDVCRDAELDYVGGLNVRGEEVGTEGVFGGGEGDFLPAGAGGVVCANAVAGEAEVGEEAVSVVVAATTGVTAEDRAGCDLVVAAGALQHWVLLASCPGMNDDLLTFVSVRLRRR